MAISPRGVVRSTSCLVLRWVFGVGGSNGAISGFTKSKMAARPPSLEKFKWRYLRGDRPIYSMSGSRMGFSRSADRMALFPFSPILKNSNGDISAADRPIYAVFGSRTGFSRSANRMALILV